MFFTSLLRDFFQVTRFRLALYGLGFILAGFLTLSFPYLLIGVVVTVLFLIGGILLYLSWKIDRVTRDEDEGETIIIESRKENH